MAGIASGIVLEELMCGYVQLSGHVCKFRLESHSLQPRGLHQSRHKQQGFHGQGSELVGLDSAGSSGTVLVGSPPHQMDPKAISMESESTCMGPEHNHQG